jgi:membrane protein DedA with SNARE-associated domain
MASIIELVIVLLTSFGFNMIPFAGPSNLFIASSLALYYSSVDPFTLGFLVALGAALAKSVHYMVTFFVSKHLNEERRKRLDADGAKVKRWGFWLLFAAAATPIPDEPIIIPLGLMKYSPPKFFVSYFLGKLLITVVGAYLGTWTAETVSGVISQEAMIAISIVLTVVVTIILLKFDLGKLYRKFFRRKGKAPNNTSP